MKHKLHDIRRKLFMTCAVFFFPDWEAGIWPPKCLGFSVVNLLPLLKLRLGESLFFFVVATQRLIFIARTRLPHSILAM